MGTITQKLSCLLQTKEKIRQAIIHKGVAVPEGTAFGRYGTLIEAIANGDGMKICLRANYSKHNAAGTVAVPYSGIAIKTAAEQEG